MFGQFEPQPDLDTIPHAAGCIYFDDAQWRSDEPQCSEGCVEAWLDIPRQPRVQRRAS